jgi:hypothetical protein
MLAIVAAERLLGFVSIGSPAVKVVAIFSMINPAITLGRRPTPQYSPTNPKSAGKTSD